MTIQQWICRVGAIAALCLPLTGCLEPSASNQDETPELTTQLTLTEIPDGVTSVIKTKELLQPGEAPAEVVVEARIGGLDEPVFDPERAAFLVADLSLDLNQPDHGHDGEDCPFCQKKKQEMMAGIALVELVDERGDVLPYAANRVLPLDAGQTVIVTGQGRIDGLGNLVVQATGVYAKPTSKQPATEVP
jgi:hypothetical protein